MLTLFRKHAESWMVKAVFGLIAISFIIFFGYSRVSRRYGTPSMRTAAMVNGEEIPMGEYRLTYENMMKFYKENLKGEISSEMTSQIRSEALKAVVGKTLFAQFGRRLGLQVTDTELLDAITNEPLFQEDGHFSKGHYMDFLNMYSRQGIDYESLLKKDLLAAKTRKFLSDLAYTGDKKIREDYKRDNITWVFRKISIPLTPKEGVKTYDPNSLANEIINNMKSQREKDIARLVKEYKLADEEVETTLDTRERLVPSNEADMDDIDMYRNIFSLNQKEPVFGEPIKLKDSLVIIKLNSVKIPTDEDLEKDADRKKDYIAQTNQLKAFRLLAAIGREVERRAKIKENILPREGE